MMQLKKGDLVKLVSWKNWLIPEDGGKTPLVWGGPHGFKLGTVLQTFTGLHDSAQHSLSVNFPNGETVNVREDWLELASPEDKIIVADSVLPAGPVSKDIWVLIRTSSGNFSLNIIEALPFGATDGAARYVVGVTRFKTANINQSDYNLVHHMLSQVDYCEKRTGDLFEAANQIFLQWDLPPLDYVSLPLPEFHSVAAAAASCPKEAQPAVLFFHTPHSLIEFSDSIDAASS